MASPLASPGNVASGELKGGGGGSAVEQLHDWLHVMGGRTLVLDTPAGVVWCPSSLEVFRGLVARGEVAFAPTELAVLLEVGGDWSTVVRLKRMDPAARVVAPGFELPARRVARWHEPAPAEAEPAKEARPAKPSSRQGVLL